MNFDDMKKAVNDAEATLRFADIATKDMVGMVKGRLRMAYGYDLAELKKELREFNAVTHEWKS